MGWVGAFVVLAVVVIVMVSRHPRRRADRAANATQLAQPSPVVECLRPTAIELGIALMQVRRDADDGTLRQALEAIGVAPWLAARLVTWIPQAFAARLLTGMNHVNTYTDPVGTYSMADDPICRDAVAYAAAYAAELPPEAVLAIAERSGLMHAVRGKTRTRDLAELAALDGSTASALLAPLPTIVPGDGGVPEPRAALRALFDAHEGGNGVELEAFVVGHHFGRMLRAQFDFIIRHERVAGGRIVESFSGEGTTYRAALADALGKFSSGSLHPCLRTLVGGSREDVQVTWQSWTADGVAYEVCLGLQLVLWSSVDVDVTAFVDVLRAQFERRRWDTAIHAVRLFVARDGTTSLADEVLLDGEMWEPAVEQCRAYAWPVHASAWAARLFFTIAPARAWLH